MQLKDKHSKKSEQYTSAQTYTDIDGNLKSFTMIDHDRKTSINTTLIKDEDKGKAAKDVQDYRGRLIEKILSLPASFCPMIFTDYTIKGENHSTIVWNEKMVRDNGVPLNQLSDLYTLTSNAYELGNNRLMR